MARSATPPEIAATGDVTLRVRAARAASVAVVSGGDIPGVPFNGGLALTKAADGTWQVTLPALDPGAYRYRFTVDGGPANDPNNPAVSQSNGNAWSLFYVPGSAFMDERRVPGAVTWRIEALRVVGRVGIEPTTNGLKVRCSTN